MATWTPRNAMRGIAVSRWGRPPPPPYFSPDYPSSDTLASTSPDSDLGEYLEFPCPTDSDTLPVPSSPMDDPEVDDWLETQLASTGEMSVVERLQYLLDTGQFADVNIRVGQGNNVKVFKAHRLLLATASQPLYKLVYTVNPNPGPNDVTTIRVTDMKASDFEHILKYIYTDIIDCKNINVAFELLRASKKWGLAGLGIKSLTYLEEFLDDYDPSTEDMKTNLFDLLVLSEQSLSDMYEKCFQVLTKHCNEIIPCEGFLNLDKPLVKKVVLHDGLVFGNHLKLFEAIRDWGLRYINAKSLKISQLGDVVEELIKVVDFEKIEDNDFVATVLTSECLGKAEVIAFFMTRGLEIPRNLDFNNNKQLPFWLWFCATTDPEGKEKESKKGGQTNNQPDAVSGSSPSISLKNGTAKAFQKVCRFKKGYRCPQEEIYLPHELRFRVSKAIKLMGIGFGFLFSCTDMGVTIHCQGPWETRQWTDILQTYCRVSGEKQETADVRLMFAEPVRIEANHSYKVMVKIGRMSSGTSEVDLWGGTAGQYTVQHEETDFFFVKAAVDPNTKVEERDGDVNPGIITDLLYQLDTDDHSNEEPKVDIMTRRRRPKPEEEEEEEGETQQTTGDSPWRKRHRAADLSLQIPEVTRIRRRGDGSDSISYSPKKSPIDEYKPMSFSTNRWKPKSRDEDEIKKASTVDEYLPSSFSTNRWRIRPKVDDTEKTTKVEEYKPSSFATNRWRTSRTQGDSTTSTNIKTPEDTKPSTFSTNRWRAPDSTTNISKPTIDDNKPSSFATNRWKTDTKSSMDTSYGSRKTSAEEKQPEPYNANRWRTRSREEIQPPKVELRKTIGASDDKTSSLPFMRRQDSTESKPPDLSYLKRRESTETKVPEMPAYLRKRANPVEENTTATPFGRSRWGSSLTSTDDTKTKDTPIRSRFLGGSSATSSLTSRPSDTSSSLRTRDTSASRFSSSRDVPSSRTNDSTLSSRSTDTTYGRTRDSSLSRFRDSSSSSRFGPSSTSSYGSSYMSRYDSSKNESGNNSSTAGTGSRYGSSSSDRPQRKYVGAGSDSTLYRNRYGPSLTNGGTNSGTSNRYGSAMGERGTSVSAESRYESTISSGLKDLDSKYGSSLRPTDLATSSSKYSSPGDTGSSSRYSRYSSPFSPRSTDSTSKSTSSKYGSSTTISPSSPYEGNTSSTSSSSRYGTGSTSSRYGNDVGSGSRYGSTSTRYGTSSNRY